MFRDISNQSQLHKTSRVSSIPICSQNPFGQSKSILAALVVLAGRRATSKYQQNPRKYMLSVLFFLVLYAFADGGGTSLLLGRGICALRVVLLTTRVLVITSLGAFDLAICFLGGPSSRVPTRSGAINETKRVRALCAKEEIDP